MDRSRVRAQLPPVVREHLPTWHPASFLAQLPVESLLALTVGRKPVGFALGERIVVEGDPGHDVFLLISALVKVTARVPGGTALLAIRSGGDIIGDMAAVDGSPRSATVTAAQNHCLLLRVPGAEFRDFVDSHPGAGHALNAVLAQRLRVANQRRVDFAGHPARVRVARVLLYLADLHGISTGRGSRQRELRLRLTQEDVATLAGMRKDSISPLMKELRDNRIVDWRYRAATVLDMTALRTLANGEETGGFR